MTGWTFSNSFNTNKWIFCIIQCVQKICADGQYSLTIADGSSLMLSRCVAASNRCLICCFHVHSHGRDLRGLNWCYSGLLVWIRVWFHSRMSEICADENISPKMADVLISLLLSSSGRNRCSIWCSHVHCHGREPRRLRLMQWLLH